MHSSEAVSRFAARYGGDDGLSTDAWNEVLTTLLDQRSIRRFAPRAVPSSVLPTLVAAAQSAPSSSNLQTWSVIAVEDPARKARLAALAGNQAHVLQAPLFLVWLADLARNDKIGRERGKELDGLNYIEMLFVAIIDAGLAAQNALVAAQSLGLGAVYIGAIRNHPEQVAAELGLPPRVLPVFGMCIGYADPTAETQVKPRLPQAAVLHHETYDAGPQSEAVRIYDERFRTFEEGQSLGTAGWIKRVIQRLETKEGLSGRDRMTDALRNLGFETR